MHDGGVVVGVAPPDRHLQGVDDEIDPDVIRDRPADDL
jgi:hypothetical protein